MHNYAPKVAQVIETRGFFLFCTSDQCCCFTQAKKGKCDQTYTSLTWRKNETSGGFQPFSALRLWTISISIELRSEKKHKSQPHHWWSKTIIESLWFKEKILPASTQMRFLLGPPSLVLIFSTFMDLFSNVLPIGIKDTKLLCFLAMASIQRSIFRENVS